MIFPMKIRNSEGAALTAPSATLLEGDAETGGSDQKGGYQSGLENYR